MFPRSNNESRLPGRRSAAFLFALLIATAPARGEIINRILATVDGDPVTMHELRKFAAADVRLRQANYDPGMVLDALITKRLIEKEVEAKGLSIGDAEVDRYIGNIRDRNQLTDEQLAAAVAQQGLTMEAYRTQVREELLRAQLLSREISGKVNVTPEEVKRYYEANRDEFEKTAEIAVSHIILQLPQNAPDEQVEQVMARAQEIHAMLDGGAPFAAVARRYSEDAAAQSGGKLGTFKRGELFESIEEELARLEPGQYGKPVRSPVGVHILRLDERASGSGETLESLAEEIKERLYNAALEERYNRWLREDLRKRHHVELRP
jgi:peptidyl-prolyl cis-trans isomerase SurA